MAESAAALLGYLDDADGSNAKERKNQCNRASGREATMRRGVKQYNIDFPKAQGIFIIQSGFSPNYPVLEVFGPMSNDAVFANNLLDSLVRLIDAKNLRPAETHKLTIDGGGKGHVGVEELVQQATLRGELGPEHAKRLLALSKLLNTGEPWVLEQADLNWGCRRGCMLAE